MTVFDVIPLMPKPILWVMPCDASSVRYRLPVPDPSRRCFIPESINERELVDQESLSSEFVPKRESTPNEFTNASDWPGRWEVSAAVMSLLGLVENASVESIELWAVLSGDSWLVEALAPDSAYPGDDGMLLVPGEFEHPTTSEHVRRATEPAAKRLLKVISKPS